MSRRFLTPESMISRHNNTHRTFILLSPSNPSCYSEVSEWPLMTVRALSDTGDSDKIYRNRETKGSRSAAKRKF